MNYLEKMFSLQGKTAAVLGGSSTLGGAMGLALGQAGAKVAFLYHHSREKAEEHASSLQKAGGEGITLSCSITSRESITKARDALLAQWGQVDILLYAPALNAPTSVQDISEDEWDQIMAVNLKGLFLSCQVFGEHMISRGDGGCIIAVSSVSSILPLSKVFTYSISKHGLNGLVRFLAREWAPYKIRVNAIAPGFFPTPQNQAILTEERKADIHHHTPMNRYGEPEELAGVTVWLASDQSSSFVTGAIVPVDGGFTAMTI